MKNGKKEMSPRKLKKKYNLLGKKSLFFHVGYEKGNFLRKLLAYVGNTLISSSFRLNPLGKPTVILI